MSSDADTAAAVAVFNDLYTGGYCYLAASSLFIYDTTITLNREMGCFWTTKRSGAALLFFANKWISMALHVMTLSNHAYFPSNECSLFAKAAQAMQILQYIPWAAFSALRAYVLSRSKPLGLLIFALSLAPVGVNLVLYGFHISGQMLPPFGCLETDSTTSVLNLRLVIASRVPLVVADILLIYITWTKLSSRDALRNIQHSKRPSLSDIFFRGRTVYFVMLSILNVLHLVLSAISVADNGNTGESVVTTFSGPITAILVSRFLLDLQEADRMVVRLDSDDPNSYNTPSFISSLGGFVNPNLPVQSVYDGSESQVGSRTDGGVDYSQDGATAT